VFRECSSPPLSEPFIHHLFHHGQKYKSDIPTQTLLQHQIQQNQKSQNTRYATTPVPSCSIRTTPSFQLQNDKARLVFIGRIYLSLKNGSTWDKHRRRVQWTSMAMSNSHQGISLRTQQWRKQNLPRPPDFTHPDGLSNEPH
jgi:hypothetical protein